MATEYSSITTLGQLKNAQTEIRYKIEAKEKELAENYSALKAYFNPLTYIHKIITKLYALRYLGRYVAAAYDFIKGLFRRNMVGGSHRLSTCGCVMEIFRPIMEIFLSVCFLPGPIWRDRLSRGAPPSTSRCVAHGWTC